MKCADFEQGIYLYKELNALEKKNVDDHVQGCESCRELFSQVKQTEVMLSLAAAINPQPGNFSRLTSNIMQAIKKPGNRNAPWIQGLILRYAMVAISLTLIVAFGVESFSTAGPVAKSYSSTKTVTLNSVPAAEAYRSKKEQIPKPSLYACVKNGECHTLLENFKKESL